MLGWLVIGEKFPRQIHFAKMKFIDSETVFSAVALAPAGTIRSRRTLPIPALSSTERAKFFCNPKGIVSSSPGLRGTSYPGFQVRLFSTPTGLRQVSNGKPQPRWGCLSCATFPKVARSLATLGFGRNPFGIHLRNFPKTFSLALVIALLVSIPPDIQRNRCKSRRRLHREIRCARKISPEQPGGQILPLIASGDEPGLFERGSGSRGY
jgi:hypothetical protein